MGSGASTQVGKQIEKEDEFLGSSSKTNENSVHEDDDLDGSTQGLHCTSKEMLEQYTSHGFIRRVKDNSISVQEAREIVLKDKTSLFAQDFKGKTAIDYAALNNNVPMFQCAR